jgi:large subunit ribosomal protein L35
MPKQKTNKSAKKRFRITKKGRVKRWKAGKSHRMGTFSQKRVRKLRKPGLVSEAEEKTVRRMLGAE